ncbi:cellulose biosynthesis cyclic di-GMP-binding regulatory protein BcsB [Xanthomonas sp. AM6]|uniref:cellulose biosynthesis cyclic di-GMP-binding regulatory protein BcsB n=1 Tax=Xanthomonas sp. AM6 TaxID=2982531 RepID=UPI0021D86AD7|nr:cellulose biosynthesis cyclic di-GMP-binding regulatory protein BcsB [Xanthomonas sp. AM6]UYB51664.1 cellulose biosynthesis cyclic di-GMP-binding regulatory protein BcsB [Xanthomonas sp. AM6]
MTQTRRRTARFPKGWPLALVLLAPLAPAAAADSVAGQFGEWAGQTTVQRSMTLRDLGFAQPLVLSGQESQREIYLPVPAGVPTHDAKLQVDARYMRGHTGRTSSLLSIDGDPVAARSITDAQGDASQLIGIDGFARANGFVRFGVGWWSVVSEYECADQSAPANVLRLSPESRFSYRFDGRAIDTVAKAWGALPAKVRLLVDGRATSVESYDAAWRVGAALENGGKRVEVVALPAVGGSVDLRGLSIPASLAGIPAYAALADGSASHRIGSLAEVGALLSLGDAGPLAVDVAVLSDPLRAGVRAALDALAGEVGAASPDAASAFAAWRKADMAGFEQPAAKASVQVALVGGRPTLLVATGAGAKVAGLLTEQWRAYALGRSLLVGTALQPPADKGVVLLNRLGNMAGTLDIVARGDRTASFDLGALSSDGRLPSEVVVDVSAAPNPAGQGAVASIFFNDYLVGAKVLNSDGKPQRLVAKVPGYALAARNQVRISFLRQPARPYCHDPATGYPVSVLPSSHIRLSERSLGGDFVGAASQLAGAHEVFVPSSWLQDAPATLAKVIHLASATGASPMAATLKLGDPKTAIAPNGAYLSFMLAPQGLEQTGALRGGKLVVSGPGNQVLLDVAGLDRAALVEVVGSGARTGVIYRELGAQGPQLDAPFRLIRGNLALLDARGVVQDFDGQDPTGAQLAEQADPQPVWQQHMVWLLVLVGVIVFMLLAARVTQVRRRRKSAQSGH